MKLKRKLSAFAFIALFNLSSCEKENFDEIKTEPASKNNETIVAKTCSAPGWASLNGGTTGGGSSTETPVTNYSELKSAILNSSVKVIKVIGTIIIPNGGRINFKDQTGKTLYGANGAKLVTNDQTKSNSGIFNIQRCKNLIIRNLIFEGPGAYDTDGWDLTILDNCQNVWVDHCEFRDGVDGNLDLKNKSDYITVSYTKFNYLKTPKAGGPGGSNDHRFSNLIGSSDSATGDRGKLRITFARCWWANGCRERMPRVRFGKIHIVNSYFNSTSSNKCIMAGKEADIRIEKTVFENVNKPIDLMSGYTAVSSIGNSFLGTTGNTNGSGTAFTPPYLNSIGILNTSNVKSSVISEAGATLSGNVCNLF